MPKSASDSPTLAPGRKHDRELPKQHETQIVVAFDDNGAASALVGPYGQNLALIERRLSVVADSGCRHHWPGFERGRDDGTMGNLEFQ